jgi:UPF0755 protein
MGWDDFAPPTADDVAEGRLPASLDSRRDFRSGRSSGPGQVIRFALFTVLLGGLVVGGLYFVARPIVVGGIVDWAAENPTALKLPFVADVVRDQLGSSLTQPVDARDQNPIVIIIGPNETPREIGDQLVKAGAITEARALVFQAIVRDATSDFQIGRHVVSKSLTVDEMISILTQPPVAPPTVRITFREGLRIEQMVAKLEYLEANPVDPTAPLTMSPSQFYQLAMNPPADLLASYSWLKLPAGASLEGYLFPATYDVAPDTTPIQLLTMLLDAFASHAPPELLALQPDQIYQKVQVAALVESEAKVDSDRPLIAGVYINRLNPKIWPTGLLNANPTLNYANDSVWLQDPAHPIATWVDAQPGRLSGEARGIQHIQPPGSPSRTDLLTQRAVSSGGHLARHRRRLSVFPGQERRQRDARLRQDAGRTRRQRQEVRLHALDSPGSRTGRGLRQGEGRSGRGVAWRPR